MAERARGIVGKVYGSRELLPDEQVIALMRGEKAPAATSSEIELLSASEIGREPLPDQDTWRRVLAPLLGLSPRDAEIARWVVAGMTDDEIARRLDVPVAAVRQIAELLAERGAEARSREPRETQP